MSLRFNVLAMISGAALLAGCELFDVHLKQLGSQNEEIAISKDQNDLPVNVPPKTEREIKRESETRKTVAKEKAAPVISMSSVDKEDILRLLSFYRAAHGYSKAKLEKEYKRIEKEFKDKSTGENKVQMAILLGIPQSAIEDKGRSRKLLHSVIDDKQHTSPVIREYALGLLEILRQRNKEQQTKSELISELEEERRMRKQLQEQLNALKSIEKSISKRQLETEAE